MKVLTKAKLIIVKNVDELEDAINEFCVNKNVRYIQVIDDYKAMIMYDIIE